MEKLYIYNVPPVLYLNLRRDGKGEKVEEEWNGKGRDGEGLDVRERKRMGGRRRGWKGRMKLEVERKK